jgi:hypothetical protein
MERDAAIHFLNQLRKARAAVLRDAEAVDALIHVFERMGMFLRHEIGCLADYAGVLGGVAGLSPLARKVPKQIPEDLHIPFSKLFESVREARNSAMHEGAYARHLASHAVKLALVLEDAITNDFESIRESTASTRIPKNTPMNGLGKIRDLMVPNPICAELWQPLSFIRQSMLENSFSFLPVRTSLGGESVWKLVSDLDLARYLRTAGGNEERQRRLVQSLDEVAKSGDIQLKDTIRFGPQDSISDLFMRCGGQKDWDGLPILVLRSSADLLGILTAFDLL